LTRRDIPRAGIGRNTRQLSAAGDESQSDLLICIPQKQHHAVGLDSGGATRPQRPRKRCRNCSRSSGVIRAQRSAIRGPLKCGRGRIPSRPNKMRHSASKPTACQKVICRHPNNPGRSQFQSKRTISPPMNMNAAIPRIARGPIQSSLFALGLMPLFLTVS
jgi:hypothetical protein